jgi:hypothetical protein
MTYSTKIYSTRFDGEIIKGTTDVKTVCSITQRYVATRQLGINMYSNVSEVGLLIMCVPITQNILAKRQAYRRRRPLFVYPTNDSQSACCSCANCAQCDRSTTRIVDYTAEVHAVNTLLDIISCTACILNADDTKTLSRKKRSKCTPTVRHPPADPLQRTSVCRNRSVVEKFV